MVSLVIFSLWIRMVGLDNQNLLWIQIWNHLEKYFENRIRIHHPY